MYVNIWLVIFNRFLYLVKFCKTHLPLKVVTDEKFIASRDKELIYYYDVNMPDYFLLRNLSLDLRFRGINWSLDHDKN